jgi:hypothetical protein
MRTFVKFRHPADFVPISDEDGILAVSGAQWFAELLRGVSGLQIEEELCQEDWGVVLFARRNRKKFWIGLSPWDGEHSWLAHFHHGSFAWFQRFSSSGAEELKRLLADVHKVLATEQAISEIAWHEESEMRRPGPKSFPTPFDIS